MTALRKVQIADVPALRAPRRLAAPSYTQGRAFRPQPLPRLDAPRRAAGHPALARLLRLGAAVLFGLWAVAALAFCTAVAVALIW